MVARVDLGAVAQAEDDIGGTEVRKKLSAPRLNLGGLALIVMVFVFTCGHMLHDRRPAKKAAAEETVDGKTGWRLLLSGPILIMFAFYMMLAMASSGFQSFLVTALVEVHGISLNTANVVLTTLLFSGPTAYWM